MSRLSSRCSGTGCHSSGRPLPGRRRLGAVRLPWRSALLGSRLVRCHLRNSQTCTHPNGHGRTRPPPSPPLRPRPPPSTQTHDTARAALAKAGAKKLAFIGHSQGCTLAFALLAAIPEYNDKISVVNHMGCVRGGGPRDARRVAAAVESCATGSVGGPVGGPCANEVASLT